MAESVIPVLRSADVDAAIGWYGRLGFTEEWRHQFGPDFPRFVSLARGELRLFVSEHAGDAPLHSLVWLRLDDAEALPIEDLGGERVDQPWGLELRLTDPDGNRLRIGPTAPPP